MKYLPFLGVVLFVLPSSTLGVSRECNQWMDDIDKMFDGHA
jgi:hypothetical protein